LVAALDPAGVLDMLENLQMFKDAKELINDFKQDLAGMRSPIAMPSNQNQEN